MFPSRRKASTEPTEPPGVAWESVTPAVMASGHLAFAVGPEGAVASSPPAGVLPTFGLAPGVHPGVLRGGRGRRAPRGSLSSDEDGIWRRRQCVKTMVKKRGENCEEVAREAEGGTFLQSDIEGDTRQTRLVHVGASSYPKNNPEKLGDLECGERTEDPAVPAAGRPNSRPFEGPGRTATWVATVHSRRWPAACPRRDPGHPRVPSRFLILGRPAPLSSASVLLPKGALPLFLSFYPRCF